MIILIQTLKISFQQLQANKKIHTESIIKLNSHTHYFTKATRMKMRIQSLKNH